MTKYEVELTDEQAREIVHARPLASRARYDSPWWTAIAAIADAIDANPPKPPRMTEPGWAEKVTAHTKRNSERRAHVNAGGRYSWADKTGDACRWDELVDPEPWQADT